MSRIGDDEGVILASSVNYFEKLRLQACGSGLKKRVTQPGSGRALAAHTETIQSAALSRLC